MSVAIGVWFVLLSMANTQPVNQHSQVLAEFDHRVTSYMKVRRQAEAEVPALKPTDAPATITRHEQQLFDKVRQLRGSAKEGDVFTPAVVIEFRRLMKIASAGTATGAIHRSLQHAEPVKVTVRVNGRYPPGVPVQSSPPGMLLNLPALPKGLEYRVNGADLILLDTAANLIVDVAHRVLS